MKHFTNALSLYFNASQANKSMFFLLMGLLLFSLAACSKSDTKNTLNVGTISGPETALMETAKKIALTAYGLNVHIIPFHDYNLPNAALAQGNIDANMFQHEAYLQASKKAHHYPITAIANMFIYPMGIYSKQLTSLNNISQNADVAIPNDPSNEARALLLLQKAHLIGLDLHTKTEATPRDIISNPYHLQFTCLAAAQLPRVLSQVSLAVINTNYAISSGLLDNEKPLFSESPAPSYANLLVVRQKDKNNPLFKKLIAALHSPEVIAKAKELFKGQAIIAWQPTVPAAKNLPNVHAHES